MKTKLGIVCLMSVFITGQAMASSPLPTFDKDAVTIHPYNRTGQQEVIVDNENKGSEVYRPGNTGTQQEPAFFIKKIKLSGESVPDKSGRLQNILNKYTNRSVKVSELQQLTQEITAYCKAYGYTVPQAVIPPQEIKNGELEVKIYLARYDKAGIVKNSSDIADSVLTNYINYLRPGEIMTDKKLESALNNLNDLPGVMARAVLSPGTQPGTTGVNIEVAKRPVWNNYIFTDNGGGYWSGRYRYGFNTEINNPGEIGDKLVINGMLSNKDVKNYGVRYELPLGSRGTRLGIAYSRSSYEMSTNSFYDSLGTSEGISIYGTTPVYRDKANRITAIYGYDHRSIEDELRFNIMNLGKMTTEKEADVWHIGISGSQYNVNQFTQYSLIYWYGDIDTDGGAYYDGGYHKLTGDILNIWYDNKFNYRIKASGQLANRSLDGSEQFYLGGMNGVRAYGASDGYGDYGYVATGEIRCKTDIPGLEAAAFIDVGAAGLKGSDYIDHIAGWGLGLRYAQGNDWYAQLDWARKIDGRRDLVEPNDHSGRWWFQLYKMF